MEKRFSVLRISLFSTIIIALSLALFSSCQKSNNENTDIPAAGLMAFNLVPDKTVAVTIGGNMLGGSALPFSNYTGGYLPIYSGTRTIESFDYSTNSSLATATDSFAVDKYYSVFVVGTTGTYQNVIVNDNFDSLSGSSGKAYVRYINAVNGSASAAVTVEAGGSNIVNTNAPFASVSDFVAVTPGDVTFTINEGTAGSANRTFTTEARNVYTVLLISGATSTDPAQIKYITNGTLDETDGQRVSNAARSSAIN